MMPATPETARTASARSGSLHLVVPSSPTAAGHKLKMKTKLKRTKNPRTAKRGGSSVQRMVGRRQRQQFTLSVTRSEFLTLPIAARRRYLTEQADRLIEGRFDVTWVTDTGRRCSTLCGTVGDALDEARRGLFDASGDVVIRVIAKPSNVELSDGTPKTNTP